MRYAGPKFLDSTFEKWGVQIFDRVFRLRIHNSERLSAEQIDELHRFPTLQEIRLLSKVDPGHVERNVTQSKLAKNYELRVDLSQGEVAFVRR